MYLPRNIISHLYLHLLETHHPLSPPVLLLVALEPDALCACRILTALLKRDYIPHKIQPVSGYGDLERVGAELVKPMRTTEGGSGGVVVCLGAGGLVDLAATLGLDVYEEGQDAMGGIEVWVIDAKRPWNLGNVFGGHSSLPPVDDGEGGDTWVGEDGVIRGEIQKTYRPGKGGIIVFDDGDIAEDLSAEREAYCALERMPDLGEDLDDDIDGSGSESGNEEDEPSVKQPQTKKRKSWSDREEDSESEDEEGRPRQRRRSNSSSSIPSPSRPARRGLLVTTDDHDTENDIRVSRTPSPVAEVKQPSARTLRRRLLRLRRKHESTLQSYYSIGSSYSEPISSLVYSLASELGREDNDLLWLAIVGVGSMELYGRGMTGVAITHRDDVGGSAGWGGERGERIRQVLRDEVRRLNPPDLSDSRDFTRGEGNGVIPTTARSPTDTSIRLSPEPRFLLIRHWSLYESMLHSPYLSAKLHIWSDAGRKRLHKLLAKMGVSLSQCKQSYTHMDMELKRDLRQSLLKYAPVYGLDGLVPPSASVHRGKEGWGFVRSWGWKACLSSTDVGVVVGAILEVGKAGVSNFERSNPERDRADPVDEDGSLESEEWVGRFWEAYDALENIDALKTALPIAMHLHRAILRTGTALIEKRQIRHLRAFRMAVVKEGPDVQLFTHPAALTKLALWIGEAIAEQEKEQKGKLGRGGKGTPLVVAGLNEHRGIYVVVGTGGGGGVVDILARRERKEKKEAKSKAKEAKKAEKERKKQEKKESGQTNDDNDDEEEEEDTEEEDSDDDSDDSDDDEDVEKKGYGRNRFGNAFQEVVEETNARVRIDSFEHCVVEVKKEDLSAFLESLSMKAVVG
ncbi:CDC45-like protein [Xylona heveae TC161]|uniref:CDC45-like protein n=1 Tax=Xylona heveae (strain CBS 132557 / TC161) TaxID=1328760 RepID=A0A161TG90_XYLHT|nr:CDC45-like protein [Xylona heveae TC161]KZF25147.1 CDC45-like protein [Xylona heveae TC161]